MGKDTTLISALHGVGPAMEKRLRSLGIQTLDDLVWYLPRTHKDRSAVTDIIDIEEGVELTIQGKVEKISGRKAFRHQRMSITEAMIGDSTGSVKIVWFNQSHIAETLHVEDEVLISGKAKKSKYGLAMQSPIYEKVKEGQETTHTGRIVPEYPLTHGITQKQIRYFVKQALKTALPVDDFLPESILDAHALPDLTQALQQIHFPESEQQFIESQRRLYFDSLLLIQLHSQLVKKDLQSQSAIPLPLDTEAMKKFVEALPFTLTDAQRKVAWAVFTDIAEGTPMNRLVVGDVGSGKTIVSAMVLYNAVLNGHQGALMAPTEILAKQHASTLRELFSPLHITVELLTSSTRKSKKTQQQLTAPDILVGTHALIQDGVSFDRLAIAVVDEQHRFGVEQRRTLKEHSGDTATMPHLLSMTATPIPRTLALALYGDLDISVIDQMPPGRKPVTTSIVPAQKRQDAYGFIRKQIEAGKQCFVICPLIEPSDKLGVRSVTAEYEHLDKEVFSDLRIEMLHGKMKSDEKEEVMQRMCNKEIDVLVATSVIEVGVDIPDATIMMIEGADRFGLAQLHQFRGRVGRSDAQSYCLLFTDAQEPPVRLKALTTSTDGFALAEMDLKLRGAGEVYGTDQSGFSETALLAFQYPELLQEAGVAAASILEQGLMNTHTPLQQKVNAFLHAVHLE